MDLTRLRTLRELSLRHTMAAVAEALFLTPSAVSQQIAQLEDDIGMQLIEKRGRGVRLTPAGERLASHAERLFSTLEEARADMAKLESEVAGTLRVAVFPTIGSSLLPPVIRAVEAAHPYLEVVLEESEPAEALSALNSWHCDVAFIDDLTSMPKNSRRNIESVPLLHDALYAMLPSTHPLASKQYVSIKDLRNERWALDSARSSFADFVLGVCRREGYEPNINAHCRGFEILSAMVSEGRSVSVVAGLRLRQTMPGISAVKLRPEIKRRISVAYRKGEREHPAIQIFLQALKSLVAQHIERTSR